MRLSLILLILLLKLPVVAQSDCNQLGIWLWHLEKTGFTSHDRVAQIVSQMGMTRVYVKVADGRVNTDTWTELVDTSLVNTYHDYGLEVWAWSYNYPDNELSQANAIYLAAQSGYDGFVVDVESEFDGEQGLLEKLFSAFDQRRYDAIDEGLVEDLPLYCTTWGNPTAHLYAIDEIDPYVDGYMPQTYVEIWGPSYLADLEFWIEKGEEEYATLGATKPIHHIMAMEKGLAELSHLERFVDASGPETSVWRLPGQGVPNTNWEILREVDWANKFCDLTANDALENEIQIYPNPTSDILRINSYDGSYMISDLYGRVMMQASNTLSTIDISNLHKGMYILTLFNNTTRSSYRIQKN